MVPDHGARKRSEAAKKGAATRAAQKHAREVWEATATAPEGETRVYYFNAYVRVEATSEEAAWERMSTEPVYISEADASDPEHEDDVSLTVLELLDAEPLDTGPACVCPPDLVARGGFRGDCRAWVHG